MISVKSSSLIFKSHYTGFIYQFRIIGRIKKKEKETEKREKKSEVKKEEKKKSCTLHSYIRVLMFNSIPEARNVV